MPSLPCDIDEICQSVLISVANVTVPRERTQEKPSRIHVGDSCGSWRRDTLPFCPKFLILRVCILGMARDHLCYSLGRIFLQMKPTQRKAEPKNYVNQYFCLFVCLMLKPILVGLLAFTIKRILTNIPFQFCYMKKVT